MTLKPLPWCNTSLLQAAATAAKMLAIILLNGISQQHHNSGGINRKYVWILIHMFRVQQTRSYNVRKLRVCHVEKLKNWQLKIWLDVLCQAKCVCYLFIEKSGLLQLTLNCKGICWIIEPQWFNYSYHQYCWGIVDSAADHIVHPRPACLSASQTL